MANKVRAEIELATNIREIATTLEQALAVLTKDRLLDIDIEPTIRSIRALGTEISTLEKRV